MAAAEVNLPPVMWAQIKDSLYITINLQDAKNGSVTFTETSLKFRCDTPPLPRRTDIARPAAQR